MANTTENKSVTEQAEKDKVASGYISRGNTGFDSLFFKTNTDLALFSNNDWKIKGSNRDSRFDLFSYTWYPEIYDDGAFELNNDNGYFINANIFNKHAGINSNNPIFSIYSKSIPSIKLRAFKPNLSQAAGLASLFKTGVSLVENIMKLDKATLSEVMRNAFSIDTINLALHNGLNKTCFKNSVDGEKFTLLYNGVNAIYRRIAAGVYMSEYEMPFYPDASTPYLKGGNISSFKQSALSDGMLGSILDTFGKAFGKMDILYSLEWNVPNEYDSISYKFNLYNRTSDDVYRNLRFIHSLIPEAMWFQNGIFQIPNTLYDVEIPGRSRYYWCAGEFACTFVGRTRYFTAYDSKQLYAIPDITDSPYSPEATANTYINNAYINRRMQFLQSKLNQLNSSSGGSGIKNKETAMEKTKITQELATLRSNLKEIDISAGESNKTKTNVAKNGTNQTIRDLNIVPDAYEINAKLTSILPSNLNTYLYGMFEHDNDRPQFGQGVDRFIQSFVRNFSIELLKTSLERIKTDDPNVKGTIDEVLQSLRDM